MMRWEPASTCYELGCFYDCPGWRAVGVKAPRVILRASRPTKISPFSGCAAHPLSRAGFVLAVISPTRWGLAVFRLALRSVCRRYGARANEWEASNEDAQPRFRTRVAPALPTVLPSLANVRPNQCQSIYQAADLLINWCRRRSSHAISRLFPQTMCLA